MNTFSINGFKSWLRSGTAIVAVATAAVVGLSAGQAMADAGASTVTGSGAVNATDTSGLSITAASSVVVTMDSNAGAIVLGATATTDAVTRTADGGNTDADTITITNSGTNNLVTFAGNVTGGGDETLTITATNTSTLFNGDVTAGGAMALVLGAGTDTITTTFDTPTASNNTIAMTIDAANAGDTVTLAVTDTQGGGNTITFANAIGGTTAIDSLTLGATTVTSFSDVVKADTVTNNATGTTAFAKTLTGNLNFNADGTVTMADTALVVGNVDNTTGTDGAGTLTIADQTTGAITAVSGTVGATNSLKAVNVTVNTNDVTFGGAVSATTITLTGNTATDLTTFKGDVTGAVVITGDGAVAFDADKKLVGAITTTVDTKGSLTFATTTTDTTIANSTVGASGKALLALTAGAATGKTATIGGDVFANTVTISNTAADGTVAFGGDITAATTVNFSAAGTLTMAANKKIVGALDAAGTYGTATFAATTTDTVLVSGITGGSNALLAVNVAPASGVTATFTGAVTATTVTSTGAGTLAFSADATGAVDMSGGGTVSVAAGKKIVGAVDNTSGADGSGTLTIGATGGAVTVVSSTVGATNSLLAVNVDNTGGVGTFTGAVKAVTITTTGTSGSTFTGGLTATTVNLNNTGTSTFSADATATTVNFGAAGTLTVAVDKKIVGAVTTSADGQGTLTFGDPGGNVTLVSGNVGTSSKALLSLTTGANGAGEISTFGGDIYADTFNIATGNATGEIDVAGNITAATLLKFTGADGILKLNGTAAQTITGAITTANTTKGNLSVTNTAGRVTFAGLVGVSGTTIGDITLATGTKAQFDKAVFANKLILTGTADVVVDATITTGSTLTTANGNTITLGSSMINGTTVFAPADSTGTLDQTAGAVTITPNAAFSSGTVKLITNGAAMDATDLASFTVKDTALFDYSLSLTNTNQDITITATAKSAATTAAALGVSTDTAVALASANTAVSTGDAAALAALNSALVTGGATATTAAKTIGLQADTLGAGSDASISTGAQATGVAFTRLAMMRSESNDRFAAADQTGFSSGGAALKNAGWFKPFGNWAKQGTRDGIKGFDANTYGMAVGLDRMVTENSRLGASFSYANTKVDGKGAGNAQTTTDSYQATVYGDYTANSYYIEGSLGFARNKNDTTRTITLPGLVRYAKGNYNANQYMVSLNGGMPLNIGGNAYFTPSAGVSWTHLTPDSYTETGAGNLNLNVNPSSVNVMLVSLGAKLHTKIKSGNGYFIPVLRAGVSYDAAGDKATATSTYTGGGAAFGTTGAKVAQLAGNAGAGLTYDDGAWSVSAVYDYSMKKDFRSHSGTLEARWKF